MLLGGVLEGQPEALGVGGVVFRNESPEIRNTEMELVSEDEDVEFKRWDRLHGAVCRQGATWKAKDPGYAWARAAEELGRLGPGSARPRATAGRRRPGTPHMCTHTHSPLHTHTHCPLHTQTHRHRHTHTVLYTHTETHTQTHTHSPLHTHTVLYTHRHTYTHCPLHTHRHTYTHRQTQTHTDRQTHRLSHSLCPFLRPLNRERLFDVRISNILSVSSGLRGSIRNTASLCFRGCLPPSSGGLPVTPSFSGPSARTWRAMLHGELSPHCILRPSQVSHPSLISA